MIDSRLRQITALIDDARDLIVDIVDNGSPMESASLRDFNHLDAARQFLNSALVYVQNADSSPNPPTVA